MSQFTWRNTIDDEIDEHGITFLYGVGASRAIQRFCEDLSNLIGYKCDWSYWAGRFRMKVLPEGLDAVRVALENEEWVRSYVVDFGDKGENSSTYFEPYILPNAQNFPGDAEEALVRAEEGAALVEEKVAVINGEGVTVEETIIHREHT